MAGRTGARINQIVGRVRACSRWMPQRQRTHDGAPGPRRRSGARRPVQGNSPDDRLLRGPDCHRPERVYAEQDSRPAPLACSIPGAPGMRFLRQDGIFQSDMGLVLPKPELECRLPPAAPNSDPRTRREDHALPIVPMSSGRLFLDRVARQQSPSPLPRHPQINTHSSEAQAKGDISTLPGRGHFYFALTTYPDLLEWPLEKLIASGRHIRNAVSRRHGWPQVEEIDSCNLHRFASCALVLC